MNLLLCLFKHFTSAIFQQFFSQINSSLIGIDKVDFVLPWHKNRHQLIHLVYIGMIMT